MPGNGPVNIDLGGMGIDTHYGDGLPVPYTDPWNAGPHGSNVSSDNGNGPSARVSGAALPNGVMPIVYGRGRVQGSIFHYSRSVGGGDFWIWFCGGPIDSIVQLYNGDLPIPASWTYEVSLGPADPSSPAYVWTFTQKFPFVCWIRLNVPEDNTLNIGPISAEVKGRTVFDPRENRIPSCNDFTTGWSSNYAGPTVDPGHDDPFCGTNASLLTFTGAENDYYYNIGSLALTAGQKINVSIYVRVPDGNPAAGFRIEAVNQGSGPGDQEQTIQNVVALDHWTMIEVTHLCTVDGPNGPSLVISFGFGDYPPAPLLVYCAQIEIKGYRGGRCLTSGSAVLPATRWDRNLPLILLDILTGGPALTGFTTGVPHSAKIPFDPTRILIGSFGDAATICGESHAEDANIPADDIRWGLDIVFNQPGQNVDTALKRARAVAPVDCYRQDDLWRCDVETPCGDIELRYNTDTNTYSNDLGGEIPQRGERPSHIKLAYADPDKNWTADFVLFPPLDSGENAEMDENSLSLDASASRRQLYQFAAYMFKVSKMKRWSLRGTPISALAHRYQRVSIEAPSQAVTPARECVVVGIGMVEGGLDWTTQLRETDPAIFDYENPGEPGGGGSPVAHDVPPVVRPSCEYTGGRFIVCFDPQRRYAPRHLYEDASWAHADVNAWDGTKINDGDDATIGGDFTDAADSTIRLDAGADIVFGAARIPLTAPGLPTWTFETSPDDAAWTPVTGVYRRTPDDGADGVHTEWEIPAAARYYRVRKGTSIAGTEELGEVQFYEYLSLYAYSLGIRVQKADGTQLGPIIPSSAVRQCVDLTEFATLDGDGVTLRLDVYLVGLGGKSVRFPERSVPVHVTGVGTLASVDTPQKPRMLRVDHATGIAEWQRPCWYVDPPVTFGGSFWSATNHSVFTAAGIDDGDLGTTAWNPNAAGVSDLTLDITGAGKVFNACSVTFNGSQAVIGKIDQFKVQYYASGAWHDVTAYLATAGTTVSYTNAGPQVATFATPDSYVISATSVRFEWDHRDVPGTPEKWRLLQLTSASIDMPVTQVQFLEFSRWNLVAGFEVWAGLYGVTNGASRGFGKHNEPQWVSAGGPSDLDYSFTSAAFDAGPYVGSGLAADRRRTNYPIGQFLDTLGDPDPSAGPPYSAPADGSNTLGHLHEVTVKSIGVGTPADKSVSRFAWDYAQAVQCGTSL